MEGKHEENWTFKVFLNVFYCEILNYKTETILKTNKLTKTWHLPTLLFFFCSCSSFHTESSTAWDTPQLRCTGTVGQVSCVLNTEASAEHRDNVPTQGFSLEPRMHKLINGQSTRPKLLPEFECGGM